MSTKTATTSIFTDDSGARKRTVTVAIRGAVAVIGLGLAAVAVSVFGHVTLPGLEAPLHIPGINSTNPATKGTEPDKAESTRGDLSTGTVNGTSPTAGNSASTAQPPAPPTPSATPTQRATGRPTARPTTAATPIHGTRPTDPGQSQANNIGQ